MLPNVKISVRLSTNHEKLKHGCVYFAFSFFFNESLYCYYYCSGNGDEGTDLLILARDV